MRKGLNSDFAKQLSFGARIVRGQRTQVINRVGFQPNGGGVGVGAMVGRYDSSVVFALSKKIDGGISTQIGGALAVREGLKKVKEKGL